MLCKCGTKMIGLEPNFFYYWCPNCGRLWSQLKDWFSPYELIVSSELDVILEET